MGPNSPISIRQDKEDAGGSSHDSPSTPRSRRRSAFFKGPTFALERTDTMITIGKLKLRGKTDDLPQ